MTGAELRAYRKAAGLTQIELAMRADMSRHTVQYWERKPFIKPWEATPKRFGNIMGLPYFQANNARTRGWGLTWLQKMDEKIEADMAAIVESSRAREAARLARRRRVCGARTRKGGSCLNKSEPGKERCKFHGGKSTGPKTEAGKARIAEAQRLRWAKYRAIACYHLTSGAQGAKESLTRLVPRTGANDSAS